MIRPAAKRELAHWETELVRDVIAEGIARGVSKEDMRRRRAELMAELGTNSENQIMAVGAHLRIKAPVVLKRVGLDDILTPDDLIGLWHGSQRLSPEREDAFFAGWAARVSREREAASVAAQLRAAKEHFAAALNGAPPPGDAGVYTTVDRTEEPKETELPQATTGAHANYDNEAKIAWRAAWEGYLQQHLSNHDRRTGHVLCFASKNPWPELDIYLRLGFQPERIVIVEGGDEESKRGLLEALAQRPELKFPPPLLGRLEDHLETLRQKQFRVVSLDFIGQYCGTYWDIMAGLSLTDSACVLLNVKGNRETSEAQAILRLSAGLVKGAGTKGMPDLFSAPASEDDYERQMRAWMEKTAEPTLKGSREDGLRGIMKAAVGASGYWRSPYLDRLEKLRLRLSEPVEAKTFRLILRSMGDPVTRALGEQLGQVVFDALGSGLARQKAIGAFVNLRGAAAAAPFQGEGKELLASVLKDMLTTCYWGVLGRAWISHSENYSYASGVSQSHSPFHSVFATTRMLPAGRFKREFKVAADFVLAVMLAGAVEGSFDPSRLSVLRDKGDPWGNGKVRVRVGDREVASARFAEVIQALMAMDLKASSFSDEPEATPDPAMG